MNETDNQRKIPWGPLHSSTQDTKINLQNGAELILKMDEKELRLQYCTAEGEREIHRFVTGPGNRISIDPGMPDLPVVIKPDSELMIMPGKNLVAHIEIPMVLMLQWGTAKKKHPLKEYPFKKLSRSWFGDSDNGEIAYFMESPFHYDYRDYEAGECCVYCSVNIINKSNQPLKLERMILRVPYLSIYKGKSLFFSGKTTITFRGQDQISQLSLSKQAPDMEEELHLVSSPRQSEDNSVLSKSFYFIKTLYEG